jgi:hypothetical protein
MARSILAVLAGWGSVGVLVVLTDGLLHLLFPGQYTEGKQPPDHLAALSLLTSTCYSVLGGWVTARIAKSKPWRHILALIVWGELMGVLSLVMTWGQIQAWYQIGLIAAWLPAVVAGGWIRAGRPTLR